MTRWIVFEPTLAATAAGDGTSLQPSERAVFVRDAFAKWAVLFPFLWLLRHGLILSGILAFAAIFAFGLLANIPGLGPAAAILPLLLGAFVALEGPSLRAAKLRRKGFTETMVVDAIDEEEAAIFYYAGTAGNSARTDAPSPPAVPRFDRSAFFEGRRLKAEGRSLGRSLLDPSRGR
ncbi:MAG: DUF2628 domain-containing protein [Rhizobiaceae bacterium]|nr:DUF2628 domain-containing protein [Rhizobiaceae bacterium]